MKQNPIPTKANDRRGARQFRRDSLLAFIGARLAQVVLATFGASILVWALLPLAPGDTAERVLQARGVERPRLDEIKATREEL